MTFRDRVLDELEVVKKKVKPFNSFHEGYGVLMEEVDEFWEEVKKRSSKRDHANMLKELVQIAGICERIAENLLQDILEVKGK